MTRLEGLLGAVDRLVRAPGAEADVRADARAFLERAGLAADDAEVTARAGPARLLVYRKLVRNGIAAAVRQEIPRTAARLGEVFDELVVAFVEERAPRSHYLRDVAFELVDFAAPRMVADPRVPAWLGELARHELSEYAAGSALDAPAVVDRELALDRGVVFDPSVHVGHYEHAVHELSEDLDAGDEPRRVPTCLLVYRDAAFEVRYLALEHALYGIVVEALLGGASLQAALEHATRETGADLDDQVLARAAALLTDLQARGALLGSAPIREPGATT